MPKKKPPSKDNFFDSVLNYFIERNKEPEKEDDAASLLILSAPQGEQSKIRMIGLFEELDEEKTGDICTALLALK